MIPIQDYSILRISNEDGKKLKGPPVSVVTHPEVDYPLRSRLPTKKWVWRKITSGIRSDERIRSDEIIRSDERVLYRAYRRYRTDCSVPF